MIIEQNMKFSDLDDCVRYLQTTNDYIPTIKLYGINILSDLILELEAFGKSKMYRLEIKDQKLFDFLKEHFDLKIFKI